MRTFSQLILVTTFNKLNLSRIKFTLSIYIIFNLSATEFIIATYLCEGLENVVFASEATFLSYSLYSGTICLQLLKRNIRHEKENKQDKIVQYPSTFYRH